MQRLRGFTLFELVFVVCLIAVLATFALSRFGDFQEAAEEIAVEQDVAALRLALMMRSSDFLGAHQWQDLDALPSQNPFSLLEAKPANYGGLFAGVENPGFWYYAQQERELRYRARRGSSLGAGAVDGVLRYRVVGMNSLGQAAKGAGVAYVTLKPAGAYTWAGRELR